MMLIDDKVNSENGGHGVGGRGGGEKEDTQSSHGSNTTLGASQTLHPEHGHSRRCVVTTIPASQEGNGGLATFTWVLRAGPE